MKKQALWRFSPGNSPRSVGFTKLPSLKLLSISSRPGRSKHCTETVYRKATNADIVLHYNSNSPASHKRSCVTALLITTHGSNAEARSQEMNYLHRLFDNNDYPLYFINVPCVNPLLRPTGRLPPPPTWRALPYIKNVSELIPDTFVPSIFS